MYQNPPADRLPAGVQLDGEAWGGRYVHRGAALDVVEAVEDDRSLVALLEWAAAHAAHARGGARAFWLAVADRAAERLGEAEEPPEGPPEEPPEEPPETEPEATEWEIGVDYLTGGTPVELNFRIRRLDGQPFGLREAEAVFRQFTAAIEAGELGAAEVPGYTIAGIDWKRPRQVQWSHGELGQLGNLRYPLLDPEAVATLRVPKDVWYAYLEMRKALQQIAHIPLRFGGVDE